LREGRGKIVESGGKKGKEDIFEKNFFYYDSM